MLLILLLYMKILYHLPIHYNKLPVFSYNFNWTFYYLTLNPKIPTKAYLLDN